MIPADDYQKELFRLSRLESLLYRGRPFIPGNLWPISSFAISILGLIAGRPILDAVEKKLPRIELILLADAIRSRVKQLT